MELFGSNSIWGLLGSVGLTLAGYVAQRYVIPFLKIGKRQKYAELISRLADELTDELKVKYPENQWLSRLDEAVDKLIALLGIDPSIARRAINAAAGRK